MSEMSQTPAETRAWDVLARRAASARSQGGDPDELRQLLTFLIDSAPYAVPVESVREIVRLRPITPVPRVTRDVRGVISLRGEILQVIDLRMRLGLSPTASSKKTRIVVVRAEDGSGTGVLVDEVREVLRVSEDALVASATGDATSVVEALCANGDEFISLVDLERVLDVHGGE